MAIGREPGLGRENVWGPGVGIADLDRVMSTGLAPFSATKDVEEGSSE